MDESINQRRRNEASLAALAAAAPSPAPVDQSARVAQLEQDNAALEQRLTSYKQMRDVRDDEFALLLARNRQLEAIVQQYQQMALAKAQGSSAPREEA